MSTCKKVALPKEHEGICMCREVIVKYGKSRRIRTPVNNSEVAVQLFRRAIEDHSRETFIALYLDAKNKPLGWRIVAVGGVVSCDFYPFSVFQGAALLGASALILGHNHPSGDVSPSAEDVSLTEKFQSGCDVVGLRLLDHVVFSHGVREYRSLRDDGLWPKSNKEN